MAVQRDSITVVPPDGETVVVDILEDDVSLGTVHADRSKTRTLTLPLTITARTSFYVPVGSGPYDVSVKLGDDEIAGADGTPVTVSRFPAEVRARIDADELGAVAGASGGSVPSPSAGDAAKIVIVSEDESGYELVPVDAVALTESAASAAYVAVAGAVSAVTRDGSNRLTGFTENGQVVSSIVRDGTTGLVTSFDVNGVTHTVTRDGSNRVTGVS